MPVIDPDRSTLLVIDLQERLMPAVDGAEAVVANAKRLIEAARLLGLPIVFTEQNAKGLGPTVPGLVGPREPVAHKMTFDACGATDFAALIPEGRTVVALGCEAHVCVLQTVLGLLGAGRDVHVVRDAIGARRAESKETAIDRMVRHGADVVTAEMVVFEWLVTAEHARFREAVRLVK